MLCWVCYLYRKTIDLFDTGNYHKKSNLKYFGRNIFRFHLEDLLCLCAEVTPFLS